MLYSCSFVKPWFVVLEKLAESMSWSVKSQFVRLLLLRLMPCNCLLA